jgi:hypothetical protein
VIRDSIGARLGTADPPTSGIGAAAQADGSAGAKTATAPIATSAENIRIIVRETLRIVMRRQHNGTKYKLVSLTII